MHNQKFVNHINAIEHDVLYSSIIVIQKMKPIPQSKTLKESAQLAI